MGLDTFIFKILKFQQLFSTGIKQNSECSDLENGIGLAVFGRETRLIQEATSDYELVIDLLGNIIYIGSVIFLIKIST